MLASSPPQPIDGIDSLLNRYDVFLVDQFGVLHDGHSAFPGARAALQRIRAAGGQVIIMSNSGKRAASNVARLHRLGFDDSCYHSVVSSGEVAWHVFRDALDSGRDPSYRQASGLRLSRGARCYLVSNDGDTSPIDGLPMEAVDDLELADVVLLAGVHGTDSTLEDCMHTLQSAIDRGVPCVCTNPDKLAYTPSGPVFSAGAVAEAYADAGGQVVWLGKPYGDIYRYCLSLCPDNAARVLCIGDSVEHDIQGGHRQQLATALVRAGIYQDLSDAELAERYRQFNATPTWLMNRFE